MAEADEEGNKRPGPSGLRSGDDRIRFVEEQFGLGTWQVDLAARSMGFSPGLYHLLGLDPQLIRPSVSALEALMHPADKGLPHGFGVWSWPGSFTFRIIRPDGDIRWLTNRVLPFHAREGRITQVFGAVADVTDITRARLDLETYATALKTLADLCSARFGIALEPALAAELADPDSTNLNSPQDSLAGTLGSFVTDPVQRARLTAAWQAGLAGGTPVAASGIGRQGRAVVTRGAPLMRSDTPEWLWIVAEEAQLREWTETSSETGPELTAAEIRCARGLLDWSAQALADAAGVSFSTIRRMETDGHPGCRPAIASAVRRAFEQQGVSFARDASGNLHVQFRAKSGKTARRAN